MEKSNILTINNRNDFRNWLSENCTKEIECFVKVKRGKPTDDNVFYYIDAVEEALCFGWIDSKVVDINGEKYQRFSPRKQNSFWSVLNLERVKRLEKLGLMTKLGREVIPENISFSPDETIVKELEKAGVYESFKKLPELYQRIRLYNISFYKRTNKEQYKKMLEHTIKTARENKTFGEWNDYGRLINY